MLRESRRALRLSGLIVCRSFASTSRETEIAEAAGIDGWVQSPTLKVVVAKVLQSGICTVMV